MGHNRWLVYRVVTPGMALVMCIFAVVMATQAQTVGDGLLIVGLGWPLFLFYGLSSFLVGRARLDLYSDHLVVQTAIRVHSLPLADIAQVKGVAPSSRYVAFKTTSGRLIGSRVIYGLPPWSPDPKFEERLAEVRDAIDTLRGAPTAPASPVGRHFDC